METFRFINFQVHQDAKQFYKKILGVVDSFPKIFDFDLKSQLRRAALSVILNIAEGSAKESDKDFNRYIENSLGSVNEVAACLEISLEIKLIAKQKFDKMIFLAESIAKQLGGLSKKLKNS